MVTKSHKQNKKEAGRIKVGKLKLNKETVKNLTAGNEKGIRGGLRATPEQTVGGYMGICVEETMTCLIVSVCGRCR